MAGIDDFEYQTPQSDGGLSPSHRRFTILVVLAIAALVIGIGAYLWLRPAPAPPQSSVPEKKTVEAPTAAVTAPSDVYVLPPLADSDKFLRERFITLSTTRSMALWLGGMGLAGNLTAVLDNTSRGVNPSRHLQVLRPSGGFRTIQRGNRIVPDPRNYQRFAAIVETVSSIDPEAAARLYIGIKPLLQMAYDEFGNQEPIDRALERAIRQLLSAPVVDDDVPLEVGRTGAGYRFASPALESLSGAQKQLIRMGPENQRVIQTRLRLFAMAAGISPDGR